MSSVSRTPVMQSERDSIVAAVREALRGDEVLIAIHPYDTSVRADYWEQRYHVAWASEKRRSGERNAGTHMVCIDSTGKSMLIGGHYDLTADEAIEDATERNKNAPLNTTTKSARRSQ